VTVQTSSAVGDLVRINAIAAGGDGVGRLADGRALFVPRTAAGDLIEPIGLDIRARFARAREARIVEPGPHRTEPRCRHYQRDRCGGCQLQHLDAEGQREVRSAIVGDALRRIGHLEIANPELEPAPSDWGYRTKLTLAVKGRMIGLHQVGSPERIFHLDRCEITAAPLNDLWAVLSPHRALLPSNAERVVLRLAREGTRHLLVECGPGPVWTQAAELFSALLAAGQRTTIWWQPPEGAARVLAGSPDAYPAAVFEQVHPAMGDRVRRYAVGALGSLTGRRVWDLYAGIGETTSLLVEGGAMVESVERDHRAVGLARPADPGRVRQHVGAAEEVVGRLGPADLVITNPPRTGMDARVIQAIRNASPGRMVYISCDPATLARDLSRLLAPGLASPMRLTGLRAFDLFPQTAHVETVVVLEAA
jgi:23S rRNA (uracil1939-C5)-methyltransferase